MAEILLAAGFASTKYQVGHTAEKLSEYFEEDVEGICYTDALRKKQAFFDRDLIISHSGGIDAIQYADSQQVVAVAPPVPHTITNLVTRGFKKMRQCEDAFDGSFKQSSLYEGLGHGVTILKQIHRLIKVNGFGIGQCLARRGIDVTLAWMKDDGLFDYASEEARRSWLDATNYTNAVKVKEINGDHVRFTNDPIKVLGEVAAQKSLLSPRLTAETKEDRSFVMQQLSVAQGLM